MSAIVAAFRDTVQSVCAILDPANPAHKLFSMNSLSLARARGMTEIAEAAGITREALYKALRPDSAPRFDTMSRVCAALGVRSRTTDPSKPEGVGRLMDPGGDKGTRYVSRRIAAIGMLSLHLSAKQDTRWKN
jgi:probable addiction module antidote protein